MLLRSFRKKILPRSFGDPQKKRIIAPIINLLEQVTTETAEKCIARFVLKICEEIEKGNMNSSDGDVYASSLEITIGDKFPN